MSHSHNTCRSGALCLSLLMALLIAFPAFSAPAGAEVGAGSTVKVTSQIRMLFTEGGGYIDWEISGEVVKDIRRNIDQRMGNGDGNVTANEGQAYIGGIDQVLEGSYIRYGCARIVQTALLRKDIHTDTEGLLVSVNSSQTIVIHFYFNADLRTDAATINFAEKDLPLAPFRALVGDENQTFTGALEWKHTEIMVGIASFSGIAMEKGSVNRVRGPAVEVLFYETKFSGAEAPNDSARYETFNVLQCSLELFILICVLGLATVILPRYYMKEKKMRKVKWLHSSAWLFVLLTLLLFFLGADGVFIWLFSPLFLVLSWFLSYKIYVKGWKGIAKPLISLPDSVAPEKGTDRKPGESSYKDIVGGEEPREEPKAPTKESWKPGAPPDFPGPAEKPDEDEEGEGLGVRPPPRAPAPPPAPPSPPPAPASAGAAPAPPAPAPSQVKILKLRCPKCKNTFDTRDEGTRPLKLKCTSCGAEGALRK